MMPSSLVRLSWHMMSSSPWAGRLIMKIDTNCLQGIVKNASSLLALFLKAWQITFHNDHAQSILRPVMRTTRSDLMSGLSHDPHVKFVLRLVGAKKALNLWLTSKVWLTSKARLAHWLDG